MPRHILCFLCPPALHPLLTWLQAQEHHVHAKSRLQKDRDSLLAADQGRVSDMLAALAGITNTMASRMAALRTAHKLPPAAASMP